MYTFAIILFLMILTPTATQHLDGVYRLTQAHEMVAEFHFTPDGHFEFGFAYGAVDRQAEGTYTVKDGRVLLQSNKTPGKDFTIHHSQHKGQGYTVHITDPNPYLTQHILCVFKKGDHYDRQISDNNGIVHSDMTQCDLIWVLHTLYPDAMTLIKDLHSTDNQFDLTLNPSLAGLSFKDIRPLVSGDTITIEMPWLFEKKEAVFVKVNSPDTP